MKKETKEYYREEVKSVLKELFENLMQQERREYLDDTPFDKGNGFYSRDLITSMGHLESLEVPRTRGGNFKPAILPERRRASFDLEELVFSMHVSGSSTRDISRFIEGVYSAKLGRDAITKLTDVAQETIEKWKNRPLFENYHTIFLDATFIKLRRDSVKSEPVYVAIGILPDGNRHILGFSIFGSEGESALAWIEFLKKLRQRGIKAVELFVTDNLSGMTEAIQSVFPGSKHQLCVVHQVRNSLLRVRHSDKADIAADFKIIYKADNIDIARENFQIVKVKWSKKYPKVLQSWETNLDNLLTFFDFKVEIRIHIYTTNMLERLNKEIKRRVKVIEAFGSERSLEKMMYFILSEENEKMSKRRLVKFNQEDSKHN